MVKLFVCVPSLENFIYSKTEESILNALCHASLNDAVDTWESRNPRGYEIDRARNFMAQWALESGCTHLLMVDRDIILPETAITRLVRLRADVALGWYVRGTSDSGLTNMVRLGSNGNSDCYTVDELVYMDGMPVEVKRGGMGCALIRTEVFSRFPRPWFEYHDFPNGSGLSEDYDFCAKCQKAGVRITVDSGTWCGHVKDRILEEDRWEEFCSSRRMF